MDTKDSNLFPEQLEPMSKQELDAAKAAIENQIETLQTKDGADAFVAERKAVIQSLLKDAKVPTSGRITMQDLMAIELDKSERSPDKVVNAEVSRLENGEGKSLSIEPSKCGGCQGCRGCRLGRSDTRGILRFCKKLNRPDGEVRE